MLPEQKTPSTAFQQNLNQHQNSTANQYDREFKDVLYKRNCNSTSALVSSFSMTKQLNTTISSTTIFNTNIVPTTNSKTTTITTSTTANSTNTTTTSHSIALTAQQAAIGTLRKNSIHTTYTQTSTPVTASTAKLQLTTSLTTISTPSTTTTSVTSTIATAPAASSSSSSNDASGRSAALERAYVHDVYENCEEPSGQIRPRIAQFLTNLEPGSVVCDVGCGSGRYLTQCNSAICTIGVDRCYRLTKIAKEKGGEVALCDNLELPFRDESFDAVLSLAVVHHFATTERRINALRELARILRIGGRVVITVWALEQRHRRFESQDVLIPWQPPKNRNFTNSDEDDDDDFLPPYHAYIEESTNSSRSAGDGDSSSLSSSSPGESCYSFVRRAIQKLAAGRKHPWFLDSWTSKDTKNDSSLDYEDAKDLPIELRRLEDFEDFSDPPISTGLKSRSLGSILNPPPRQIVRSRSSVPSLGGPLLHSESNYKNVTTAQFLSTIDNNNGIAGHAAVSSNSHSPTNLSGAGTNAISSSSLSRRPKLIKQKQSLCDEDSQLPETPVHMISSYNSSSNSINSSVYMKSGCYGSSGTNPHVNTPHQSPITTRKMVQATIYLRKQSSLNEELMAGNRIREKERVRKRIQKQMSLNEAFLCRSAMFSKRLQVIREGFACKFKSSTGSLERATKSSFSKIIQNIKTVSVAHVYPGRESKQNSAPQTPQPNYCQQHQQHHHHHHHFQQTQSSNYQNFHQYVQSKQTSSVVSGANKFVGPVTYCNSSDCASTGCYCITYHQGCSKCTSSTIDSEETNARRHSKESGSDSSKESSLQSDTSIESEDSFASVIFIPKPEQHQQQLNYQQQHQNSNSSSSNSSSSNGGCQICQSKSNQQQSQMNKMSCTHMNNQQQQQNNCRIPSVPTSPLIMPCPPTPAHSPAAAVSTVTSPPQTMAAVTAAMAIITPPNKLFQEIKTEKDDSSKSSSKINSNNINQNHFSFDEAHIKNQENKDQQQRLLEQEKNLLESKPVILNLKPELNTNKITRQTVKDLPPIPKFRKQQSLQIQRQNFPIVRRSSASSNTAASNLPKLLSLELFNPATDDLDSDSSEASSPDSIDSVISAPKSATLPVANETKETKVENLENTSDIANIEDFENLIKEKQQQYHNGDLKINPTKQFDIIINKDKSNIMTTQKNENKSNSANIKTQDCAEFAEQLSAQLQRELDDKNNRSIECRSLDGISDINEYLDDPFGGHKKRNSDLKDLTALREELRERRLMLANLSTQQSLQQSPTSSSTSSLSSQTRSFTIHEEDEDEDENERSYTLQLYENCKISKFKYKRNRNYNLNAETAYLLQDDGDSSVRDESETEDIEHDVIIEEDEEAFEPNDNECKDQTVINHYADKNTRNTIKCDLYDDNLKDKNDLSTNLTPKTQISTTTTTSTTNNENEIKKKSKKINHKQQKQLQQQKQKKTEQECLQNRQSTESWEHSNSSTSLDSPQGGATTHHRYYHVFREGELDALINHHVASLHIVSSYYERASWCVVAEKVQVWTI